MTSRGSIAAATAAPSYDARPSPPLTVAMTTLPNGLRVILAENHTVPLVWLNWVCDAGFEWDPPARTGLAALVPHLPRAGTARRSAARISDELDNLGADLVAGADWDAAFLNLKVLSADLAAGAGLFIDMACHARFPELAVARVRQQRIAESERRRRSARAIADEEFARALFGTTTYGRAPLGTAATLQGITAADVAAFHQAHYLPAASYLVMVGSFNSAAAVDLLGSLELPPARVPSPVPPPFDRAPATGAGVRLVDMPQAEQTHLRVGHVGVARHCEDLPALQVLTAILGRGPSSRLARHLRQRRGLTYHVRSQFVARHQPGPFVVETSVAPDAAGVVLRGIQREIETLCEELVPADEVERAKRSLLSADLQRFQSIPGAGVAIGPAALEGDPATHFDRRRRAIADVEPHGLRQLARRHLHPQCLTAVAVGPARPWQSEFSSGGAHRCQPLPLDSMS